MESTKDIKVALKFNEEAFRKKVFYETKGKIIQRTSFPVSQSVETNYIIKSSVQLGQLMENGVLELVYSTEKVLCLVGGKIKETASGIGKARVKLSPQGELTLIEGEAPTGGTQGTLVFPQRYVSPGDFWENPVRMSLPYFAKPFDCIVRSSLDKFECYDSNKICAVITNKIYSSEERKSGKFTGKETIFFDYELGNIVKSLFNMRIVSNIFQTTIDININMNLLSPTPEKTN